MKRLLSLLVLILSTSFSYSQLCVTPTSQCYNVNISAQTNNSLKVSWTKGGGSYSIVILKPATSSTVVPVAGNMDGYIDSPVYGNGTNLGSNNLVVYMGTGTSVTVTGLGSCFNFEAIVYSYNMTYNAILDANFYCLRSTVSSSNTDKGYTLATEPTSAPTMTLIGTPAATTATLSFTGTGASYSLLSVREATTTGTSPVDGVAYVGSSIYGNGAEVGGTGTLNYSTYFGLASGTVNLSNLKPATAYYARDYGFNGSNSSCYNYYTGSYALVYFTTYNYAPVMTAPSTYTVCQSASTQTISVTGIDDGSAAETQTLNLYASSSNTNMIQSVSVSYTSPGTTGNIIFTPVAGQTGTVAINLTLYDGAPSNAYSYKTVIVNILPIPSAAGTISTPTSTLCQQKTGVSFSVPAIANATGYTWLLPSGGTITSGSNTNSITASFNTALTGGYVYVYGTNSNGCGTGAYSSKYIYFDKAPTPSNAGPNQQICTNTALLAGNTPSVGNAVWTLGSGSAVISTPTMAASSITGIANTATVTAVWTITNGVCPASASTVTIANIFGSPSCNPNADFYTDNTTPCLNTPVIFYSNSIGATSYTWNFGATASPSVVTGTSATSVAVTYTTTGAKTVTLTINSAGGPDTEIKPNYVTVISAPTAPTTISGNTIVCQGETDVNYSTGSVANATSYNWSFASGINQNTGGNTNVISVNISTTAVTGTIGVNAANSCGTSSNKTITVTVNPLPTQASVISGTNTVCQGVNGIVYTANNLNNATSYVWTVPTGASIISGTNTGTITVNYGSTSASGVMSVYGSNSCGDGLTKNKFINVNPLPEAPGPITGNGNVATCPLSTNMNFSITAAQYATSYNWFGPNGYNVISGGNSNSIFVDATLNSQSGSLKVVSVNACGTSDTSYLPITVNQLPTQDICVVTVDSLSQYNEIVWQKNNSAIDSFRVYRMQSALVDTLIATVGYNELSKAVDVNANPNVTSYTYKIAAVDACGNEGPKSLIHQSIHLQTIYSPAQNKTDLSWNLYVGAPVNFYRVYRDVNNSGNWIPLVTSLAPNATGFTDLSVPAPGGTVTSVQYRVDVDWINSCDPTARVQNTSYNTSKSNTKDFVIDNGNPTGITSLLLNNIEIYPNPTNNVFTVKMRNAYANTEIRVVNQLGETVKEETLTNSDTITIDINNLSTGIYFVNIKTPIGSFTKKITKL